MPARFSFGVIDAGLLDPWIAAALPRTSGWNGVRLISALAAGSTAASTASLAYAALNRRPPGGTKTWSRTNHRGEPVTLLVGQAVRFARDFQRGRSPRGDRDGLRQRDLLPLQRWRRRRGDLCGGQEKEHELGSLHRRAGDRDLDELAVEQSDRALCLFGET